VVDEAAAMIEETSVVVDEASAEIKRLPTTVYFCFGL